MPEPRLVVTEHRSIDAGGLWRGATRARHGLASGPVRGGARDRGHGESVPVARCQLSRNERLAVLMAVQQRRPRPARRADGPKPRSASKASSTVRLVKSAPVKPWSSRACVGWRTPLNNNSSPRLTFPGSRPKRGAHRWRRGIGTTTGSRASLEGRNRRCARPITFDASSVEIEKERRRDAKAAPVRPFCTSIARERWARRLPSLSKVSAMVGRHHCRVHPLSRGPPAVFATRQGQASAVLTRWHAPCDRPNLSKS